MAKRLLEGIDVINALADERSFAEQVLVDVRDTACIRIDSGGVPLQLRVVRLTRAAQAAGDRGCRMPYPSTTRRLATS
jgi:hypothetical protein